MFTASEVIKKLGINKTTLFNWTTELKLKPKRVKKFGKLARIYSKEDIKTLEKKKETSRVKQPNNNQETTKNNQKNGAKMPIEITENTNGYGKYIEKLETDNKEYKVKIEKLENKVDKLTDEVIENNKKSSEREQNYQQLLAMVQSNVKLLGSSDQKQDNTKNSGKVLLVFFLIVLISIGLIVGSGVYLYNM